MIIMVYMCAPLRGFGNASGRHNDWVGGWARGPPLAFTRAESKGAERAGNSSAQRIVLSKIPSAPPLRSPGGLLSSYLTSLNISLLYLRMEI